MVKIARHPIKYIDTVRKWHQEEMDEEDLEKEFSLVQKFPDTLYSLCSSYLRRPNNCHLIEYSNKKTIEYLQLALVSQSEILSQEIIVTFGRIEPPLLKEKAALALVDFWHTQQPNSIQIKLLLANSLGELGCICGQTTLERLSLDYDRKVTLYALTALKKISQIT